MTSEQLGWRGPCGTTYAVNLRDFAHTLSKSQWVRQGEEFAGPSAQKQFNTREWRATALHSLRSGFDYAAMSKRSRFITFVHAATKSATNFFSASAVA